MLNPGGHSFGPPEQVSALEGFFSALFGGMAGGSGGDFGGNLGGNWGSNNVFWSHPIIVVSSCQLLGSYAPWFSSHPDKVQGVLGYLLRSLQVGFLLGEIRRIQGVKLWENLALFSSQFLLLPVIFVIIFT